MAMNGSVEGIGLYRETGRVKTVETLLLENLPGAPGAKLFCGEKVVPGG
jgi:hypothetical protein